MRRKAQFCRRLGRCEVAGPGRHATGASAARAESGGYQDADANRAQSRLLRDETGGALSDFLGLVRSTGAAVLLLGEHEAARLNGGRWEAWFARALQHYAAAFDAVGAAGLPPASAARAKAEEMFAREIRNVVAFEGPDRSERHESFAGWRRRMEDGGFQNAGIGDREAMQGRMIARMFAPGKYGVHPQGDGEGLTLRWLDIPLYTVTAWTPAGTARRCPRPPPRHTLCRAE
ncbi:hypothetical protein ZWY2020_022699 [Hordeum vulgare]|nr:hypothetical protein ZWY2020_022699 [Hordeum vulgare]